MPSQYCTHMVHSQGLSNLHWGQFCSAAGAHYDANAYWNKSQTSGSTRNSSAGTSTTHSSHSSISRHSSGHTCQEQAPQSAADEARLAAAVAAVAVAADSGLELDAFDELPYLPADAVAVVEGPAATHKSQTAGRLSATGRQASAKSLSTVVRSLFGPATASSDARLLEVAVMGDSTASTATARSSPGGLDTIAASAQGEPPELVSLKQKSKTEKRARLFLLPNGLLVPMPLAGVPLLQDDKQAIADSLKAAPPAAKQVRKGPEASVKFADTPLTSAAPANSISRPPQDTTTAPIATAPVGKPSLAAGLGLRRASVTSQGNESQALSSPARSKSFSAVLKASDGSPDGRLSPGNTSGSRQSPFHKAARVQLTQQVERSNASNTVHSSPGQTRPALPALDPFLPFPSSLHALPFLPFPSSLPALPFLPSCLLP